MEKYSGFRSLCRIVITKDMRTLFICLLTTVLISVVASYKNYGIIELKFFENVNNNHFRYLHVDADSNKLYVGAQDYIYRLDLGNIEDPHEKSQKLEASASTREKCERNPLMDDEFHCRNHIRTIVKQDDGSIYVCGTGAYSPRGFYLNSDLTLRNVGGDNSGSFQCPYDPDDNSTFIYATNPDGNRNIYFGGSTTTVSGKKELGFFRPDLDDRSNDVHSLYGEDTWFNDAHFVAAYETNEYVYFFFRETAVEVSNQGKAVYSRVARVCKNDQGGKLHSVLQSTWTSYFKAKLDCSLPGDIPFSFDEIYDVQQNGNGIFYAVFATQSNGICGSAVCEFRLDDINSVFSGSFYRQEARDKLWTEVVDNIPDPRPGLCQRDASELQSYEEEFIKTTPMMYNSVATPTGKPIFYETSVIFHKLAVDNVRGYTVLFLASAESHIYKVVQWTGSQGEKRNRVQQVWTELEKDRPVPHFYQMKFHNKNLYLGTDDVVYQLQVEQCESYTLCSECVRDPYCGWHKWDMICAPYKEDVTIQDVTTEFPVSTCKNYCKKNPDKEHPVKITDLPVHMHCDSYCEMDTPPVWEKSTVPIKIEENDRFIRTADNGLVIFKTEETDAGTYTCLYEGTDGEKVVLAKHNVTMPGCGSNKECLWRTEFRNWCDQFDNYKSQYNEWKCLKDHCVADEKCLPPEISGQCTP